MLWTGTLIVAADSLPYTGALIFALLAGGGDLGIAVVGQLVGWLSDFFGARAPAGEDPAQYGLQTAMLVAIAVPVLSLVCQVPLKRLAPHRATPVAGGGHRVGGADSRAPGAPCRRRAAVGSASLLDHHFPDVEDRADVGEVRHVGVEGGAVLAHDRQIVEAVELKAAHDRVRGR